MLGWGKCPRRSGVSPFLAWGFELTTQLILVLKSTIESFLGLGVALLFLGFIQHTIPGFYETHYF